MIHVFIDGSWYLLYTVGGGVCSYDIQMKTQLDRASWEVINGS